MAVRTLVSSSIIRSAPCVKPLALARLWAMRTSLMTTMMDEAKRRKVRHISLDSTITAHDLYKKFGFQDFLGASIITGNFNGATDTRAIARREIVAIAPNGDGPAAASGTNRSEAVILYWNLPSSDFESRTKDVRTVLEQAR